MLVKYYEYEYVIFRRVAVSIPPVPPAAILQMPLGLPVPCDLARLLLVGVLPWTWSGQAPAAVKTQDNVTLIPIGLVSLTADKPSDVTISED